MIFLDQEAFWLDMLLNMPNDLRMSSAYEVKIRHAFDSYHRNRYGHYPTWDQASNEYLVGSTQEKWNDWRFFFLNRSKEVLESASPYAVADLYLKTESCQ